MKKIIVIAYKFPPYDGIAARRWAKFCKYIAKENYTVHVITTNWKENKNSWNKDLNQSNIKIHIVNTPFLTILNAFPAFSKLLTRINFFLRYKILNKVDEADFWTKAAKKEINRLIKKEKINTVIATGAPFSVNVLASRLKNENNDLKIIQDLRDPWTDSEVVKTMQDKIKYRQFIELEKEILSNSDIIVAVTEPLVEMFRKKSPGSNALFTCITNGFDPEDKADIENKSQFNLDEKEINISYFGMLGVGRSEQIKKISEALENMPKMRLKINIFGDDKSPICTQIKNGPTKDYFNFFPYLPNEDVQYFMHISDVHLS
ncbi:MAG: hypothetical protein ACXVDV_21185, partial [Bacteroidia bacterium]